MIQRCLDVCDLPSASHGLCPRLLQEASGSGLHANLGSNLRQIQPLALIGLQRHACQLLQRFYLSLPIPGCGPRAAAELNAARSLWHGSDGGGLRSQQRRREQEHTHHDRFPAPNRIPIHGSLQRTRRGFKSPKLGRGPGKARADGANALPGASIEHDNAETACRPTHLFKPVREAASVNGGRKCDRCGGRERGPRPLRLAVPGKPCEGVRRAGLSHC